MMKTKLFQCQNSAHEIYRYLRYTQNYRKKLADYDYNENVYDRFKSKKNKFNK